MVTKVQTKNSYEVFFILKPDLSDDDIERNISQIEAAIKNYGGGVVKVLEPVRRTFTHKIKGIKDGFYISILFNSPPEAPNTLKRTMSVSDDILRFIVVKKDIRGNLT